MLNENQSIQRNGTVIIEKEDEVGTKVETVVANMNANIDETGRINIYVNIDNKDLFEKNQEEIKTDINTFMDNVYKTVKGDDVL